MSRGRTAKRIVFSTRHSRRCLMKTICRGSLGIFGGKSEHQGPIMAAIYYWKVSLISPQTGGTLEIMGCKRKKIEWTFLPPYQYRGCQRCTCAMLLQSCLTLCNPMICKQPGFSVHGILQTRVLKCSYHALLQGIFPTQGSNLCLLHLLHWQRDFSVKDLSVV